MGNKSSSENEVQKRELTEDEIEIIMNSTEYKKDGIIKFYENFVKIYPNGFVFKDDFAKLYKQLFPYKQSDEFIDKIFLAFDADKSGFVSFSELMIAISLSGQSDPVKKLHLVFNIFDKNNSKTLEISEVNSILNGFKGIMDEKDSVEVNDLMNWDKDQNGSLNEDEFINLVMSKPVLKKYFIDLIKVHE